MASLISDAQKASMESALNDVWDTFKRPFAVYREANKILLNMLPNINYSRFGQHDQNVPAPTDAPVNVPQETIIYGCILYDNRQYFEVFSAGASEASLRLRMAQGRTRLKVDPAGYEILKDAKQVTIDGFNFRIVTTPRPHGLFTPVRYTFNVERVE